MHTPRTSRFYLLFLGALLVALVAMAWSYLSLLQREGLVRAAQSLARSAESAIEQVDRVGRALAAPLPVGALDDPTGLRMALSQTATVAGAARALPSPALAQGAQNAANTAQKLDADARTLLAAGRAPSEQQRATMRQSLLTLRDELTGIGQGADALRASITRGQQGALYGPILSMLVSGVVALISAGALTLLALSERRQIRAAWAAVPADTHAQSVPAPVAAPAPIPAPLFAPDPAPIPTPVPTSSDEAEAESDSDDEPPRSLLLEVAHARRIEGITRVAQSAAHDLRNTLLGMQGAAEMLPEAPDRCKGLLNQGVRAGGTLADTWGLLAGRSVHTQADQPIDLRLWLSQAAQACTRALPPGVKLAVTPGTDQAWTTASPDRLMHALLHVALGARDRLPTGGLLTLALEGGSDQHTVTLAPPAGISCLPNVGWGVAQGLMLDLRGAAHADEKPAPIYRLRVPATPAPAPARAPEPAPAATPTTAAASAPSLPPLPALPALPEMPPAPERLTDPPAAAEQPPRPRVLLIGFNQPRADELIHRLRSAGIDIGHSSPGVQPIEVDLRLTSPDLVILQARASGLDVWSQWRRLHRKHQHCRAIILDEDAYTMDADKLRSERVTVVSPTIGVEELVNIARRLAQNRPT